MPSIGRNASPGEITMEEALPPGPPSILSQRRAQGTACDWGMAWENVCLTLLERKIKGLSPARQGEAPQMWGAIAVENSRRTASGSSIPGTGL